VLELRIFNIFFKYSESRNQPTSAVKCPVFQKKVVNILIFFIKDLKQKPRRKTVDTDNGEGCVVELWVLPK